MVIRLIEFENGILVEVEVLEDEVEVVVNNFFKGVKFVFD